MGKWFPGFRTGTKADAAAYRKAKNELERNGRDERAQCVRDETDRFHDLNRAVGDAARALSTPQRIFNDHRALFELDREDDQARRAACAQRRAGRSVR